MAQARGLLSVYKRNGASLYPFTCARTVGAAPAATPSRTGKVNRGKTEAQDIQGNAKAKNTKKQKDKAGSPGKTLAVVASAAPARPLLGRLGRHLRGGMQIFVKARSAKIR